MLFCMCCLIVIAGMQNDFAVCLRLARTERQGCKPPDVRHARQLAFGGGYICTSLLWHFLVCACVCVCGKYLLVRLA